MPGVSTGAEIAAIMKDRVCCSDRRLAFPPNVSGVFTFNERNVSTQCESDT